MDLDQVIFLTADMVERIHDVALQRFGGTSGVRDRVLLESAVMAPKAMIGGVSPFSDMVEISAAYLFYLCMNHPFVDGNKRTALGAFLLFLRLNRVNYGSDNAEYEVIILEITTGRLDREQTTKRLRALLDH